MNLFWSIILATSGVAIVIFFAEQLVKGVVGFSIHFNLSPFLISVIFLGFDPENLGVGAVGTYEALGGLATGSIIGAAMVAMALALGVTALFSPLHFKKISWRIMLIPIFSVILFSVLVTDRYLGRWDGILLLAGYGLAVWYLIRLNKKGITLKPGGEVSEMLTEEKLPGKWASAGLMILSLAAIIGGSEMLVEGSRVLLDRFQLSDTVYGMTIIAFLVSIEEIARELPAAIKGKPDITLGNVVGSVMAFFLFNAGIIALVRPVEVAPKTLWLYLPLSIFTILFISLLLLMANKIPRWAGAFLILFYLVFVILGYLI